MTAPPTPREAVARIIDRYATWDPGSFCYSVDEEVDRRNRALAKADAILALFPDSPALAALKLAAVEYGVFDPNSHEHWEWMLAKYRVCDAADAYAEFAKEQREGEA